MILSRRTLILYTIKRRKEKLNKKKRFWIRKIFLDRKLKGEYHLLVVHDFHLHDEQYFFKYFRMNVLLLKVAPRIQKSSMKRECIGPSERLCVTLMYLTTGDAPSMIATNFRISPTSIGRIIEETCVKIWNVLVKEYVPAPQSKEDWKQIAKHWQWDTNKYMNKILA